MKQNQHSAENLTILTWHESIRKRPAMYTGSTGIQGFANILKGFFANFYSFIDSAKLIEAENLSFEITNHQSGVIIFDKLKTEIPSYINEALHTIGYDFAVLNALSQNYEFTLFNKEKIEIIKQIYRQGILQSENVDEKEYLAESMQIEFELDTSIWEEFEINPIFVSDVIKELAFLNKTKTFELKYSTNNQPCRIIYQFENGLQAMIDAEKPKGWGSTIFNTYLEKDFENFSIEAAFAFWDYSVNEPFFKSFVNNHYTHEQGTHADAFISGIVRASKKYVKKYLPEENFVITKRTVLSFLLAGIHIKMKEPRFEGSVKNKLANRQITKLISDYIAELLFEKFENDHENTKSVIRHFYPVHWK